MKLKDLIRRYRRDNSLTMQDLADRSGLSKGYISMLEKGENPSTGETDYAPRTIPLDVDTLQALKEQRNSSLWVFPAATGTPSFNALRKSFTYIQRRIAPTQITLYSFRHTFATRCSRAGMAPTTLQYLMGHESITVTQKYYIDIEKEDLTIARRIIENAF